MKSGDRNWRDLSFTPVGGSPVPIRSASVTFPAADNLSDVNAPWNPEDIKKAIKASVLIRIRSSSVGDIPTFDVGQIGVFQGVLDPTGHQPKAYSADNAKVIQSKPGEFILEAHSVDDMTSPVGISAL